ncbi:MAG: CHAD domain-containing protein [Bryobacteraceae bacterium]
MIVRPGIKMREYARKKTLQLMEDTVFALHDAARLHDPESVHRMRVAIRRFQQALRTFAQYLPPDGVTKVRKQLKQAMDYAGRLRNYDIALELVGIAEPVTSVLRAKRLDTKREFIDALRIFVRRDSS